MLPEHVRGLLGLGEVFDESRLDQALDGLERPFLSMIHSQDGLDYLKRMALGTQEIDDQVEIVCRAGGHVAWKFSEFSVGGSVVLKAICIPERLPEDAPPTRVEELLIKAWVSNKAILDEPPGEVPHLVTGKTILFWSGRSLSAERKGCVLRTAESLLGFGEQGLPINYVSTWNCHTTFQLVDNDRTIVRNPKTANLLHIATKETSIRWKFLGFYRIIEFGYLSNVLSGINQEFLKNPAAVVDDAAQALKNEYNQFRKLSSENNLDQLFEDLLTEYEQLLTAYNTFASALEKRIKQDTRLKTHTGRAAKGILVVYSIRCAIVHAGEGALLFESYHDAEAALAKLIGHLERVVLAYLGVTGS